IAASFGLLVSLLFALMPLMRARRVPAATLMRGAVVATGGRLPWRDALLIGAVAMALAAFTIFTADSRSIAAWFVLGAVAAFIAFPLLARLLMLAAAHAGKPKLAGLRLALANLHRPGAPTRGLAHRCRRMVAIRLSRAAAHLLRRVAGSRLRSQAGRYHHGERAGPRHRGHDRLAPAHRVDDARHQFRLRLFARHARQG